MPGRRGWPLLLAGLALLAVAVMLWRPGLQRAAPMLPVAFEHADHRSVRCVDCHHNFTDRTGTGTCYLCHKQDPAIAADMQAMFHTLCRGCHVELAAEGRPAGPLRRCAACHHRPGQGVLAAAPGQP